MPDQVRVSVVLPVYNGARYLASALDSILGQTFRAIEVICVDDGSTDQTPAILSAYAAADPRLRVLQRMHSGLVESLNAGCQDARGVYLARMDSDDISMPDRFARQVATLDRAPSVGILGAAVEVVNEQGRRLFTVSYHRSDQGIRHTLSSGSPFAHPVVMMRRSAYEQAGGYHAAFMHAEDYDLWLRIAASWQLANLPEPMLRLRMHRHQVSRTQPRQQLLSMVGARRAAEMRAAGLSDSITSERVVTLETLSRCFDSPDVLQDRLVRTSTGLALHMALTGDPHQAQDLLDWAEGAVVRDRLSRGTRGRLTLTRAIVLRRQGKLRQGLVMGVQAATIDPFYVVRSLVTAGRAYALPRRRVAGT